METKVGKIVHKAREYIIAEILCESPDGVKPIGFSIFGPTFLECTVFPDTESALAEAQRVLGSSPAAP